MARANETAEELEVRITRRRASDNKRKFEENASDKQEAKLKNPMTREEFLEKRRILK